MFRPSPAAGRTAVPFRAPLGKTVRSGVRQLEQLFCRAPLRFMCLRRCETATGFGDGVAPHRNAVRLKILRSAYQIHQTVIATR
jgi:hypothetical protein